MYTELLQYPAGIEGFSDKIVIDMAESAAKLGVVAGLYSFKSAGPSRSGALPGGTVTATEGFSSSTVILASAAAVAVIGIGLAAGGGGGGGGGQTEPTPEPEPEPEPEPPDPRIPARTLVLGQQSR